LAPCLAVLGTGSDVGKSILVTGFCRFFANRGIRVVPFKAQNMSNNSGVTPEGLEMGRAQIVQAEAAKIPPHVNMNPVLLKPTGNMHAQVVMMGSVLENRKPDDDKNSYRDFKNVACKAIDALRKEFDLVVIEGAGSCAEVNLFPRDFVNFPMAEYVDAPVILTADIHRGGVFAQIIGTLECLSKDRRRRVAGFVINRFSGDENLFKEGREWIQKRTGKPVFGILPRHDHIRIEDEDSVNIEAPEKVLRDDQSTPVIGVVRLPHISNFNDFDPLKTIKGLRLCFVEQIQDISFFSAVIIPGSKNTRSDLSWLYRSGWAEKTIQYHRRGGNLLGICGGYQMLGHQIHDPEGLEGPPGSTPGLALLPIETRLTSPKLTTLTEFSWHGIKGTGYEIHMGRTQLKENARSLFSIHKRNRTDVDDTDGCADEPFNVMGTYLHGLFETPGITRKWLDLIGLADIGINGEQGLDARNRAYDLLAEQLTRHLDMGSICRMLDIDGKGSTV
jgi:adenosylcobyric acid synthase